MRLIDADKLKKDVLDLPNCYNGFSDTYDKACIIGVIDEQPTIEPEQRWIPCCERLPKAFEHCLWTTTDGKVVYHYCDGQFSKYIAWMPLPEPYDPLTGHMNPPEDE